MHKRHTRIYYVGGLISLLLIPLVFFISTIEIRKRAISLGSIEVVTYPWDICANPDASSRPESLYVFLGKDEDIMIQRFQQFCQCMKMKPNYLLKFYLPEKCSYNFFVQVIDILQINNYASSICHRMVECFYDPYLNFSQEYEPMGIAEEYEYIVSTINNYIWSRPDDTIHTIRLLDYREYYPPNPLGILYFPSKGKIKEEPKSTILFHTVGLWLVLIIFLWICLLILSIRRMKLLPIQALKLTE
jgi:hypothetical protein